MNRATIIDIARLAGVSTATVDRALNGRRGVSASNQQRVLRAAQELNYLPSEGQSFLPARAAQLEFFMPQHRQSFLADVALRLEEFSASLPLVSTAIVHDLPDLKPETLVAALGKTALATKGIGVVAVDHPLTRHAVRDIVAAGIKVVTIGSDLVSTPRAAYVGLDDRVAGRTAALIMGRFCGQRQGRIAIIMGQREFHGQQVRELGFASLLESDFPNLTILPSINRQSDNLRSEEQMLRLLDEYPDLLGVYCIGGGRSGIAKALARSKRRPVVIMHDLTETTRRSLAGGLIDLVIDQNARLVAEQSVIRLLSAVAATSAFLPEHFIEPKLIFRENIPL
ncbi:MAG: LacI family DNA-binding transcriptional regulator [Rhizobiaceae bacterium]|nr:LacI family DNA-binding transcriptional regulator [Rhizobiaceae bacterium]|tara:strand:+ start:11863 stop:12879 length:1017 start_codon:yes stop_codon:yes gene_type:complete